LAQIKKGKVLLDSLGSKLSRKLFIKGGFKNWRWFLDFKVRVQIDKNIFLSALRRTKTCFFQLVLAQIKKGKVLLDSLELKLSRKLFIKVSFRK
jgi:hypothetical protein